jgi:hypothetical protein
MLNISRLRCSILFAISTFLIQKTEGGRFILKDPYVFYQARHLEDLTVDLLHIRKAEQSVIIQRLLHDSGENGHPDGVDILHVGKVYNELFQSLPKELLTGLLETFSPEVINIPFGHHDGHVVFRLQG